MEIISKYKEIKIIGKRFFAIVREDPYPDWPITPLSEMDIISNNRILFKHGIIVNDLSAIKANENELLFPIYYNDIKLNTEGKGEHIGFVVVVNREEISEHYILSYIESYIEDLNSFFNNEIYYITMYDNESQPLWPPNETVIHRPVIESMFGLYSKEDAVICAKEMIQEHDEG